MRSRIVACAASVVVLVGCSSSPSPGATAAPAGTSSRAPSASVGAAPTASGSVPTLQGILGRFPVAPTAVVPAPVRTRLQAALEGFLEAHVGLVTASPGGITAALIAPGCGTWSGAAGYRVGSSPMTADTQLLLASVTKDVTAAAVLRLVEEGRVDLDAPIEHYLPADLHVDTNGATVRQVLQMRSGLRDGDSDALDAAALARPDRPIDRPTVLGFMRPPIASPGAVTEYADANYVLLSYAIELASGLTVAKAFRALVLREPGLNRLVLEDEERPQGPLALGNVDPTVPPAEGLQATLRTAFSGGYLPTRSLASRSSTAGAGVSDAPTLARWGYLLFGGSILSDESLALMTDFAPGDTPYGMGAHDLSWPPFATTSAGIGHEGWDTGYLASLLVRPRTGVTVAVLGNDERLQAFWAVAGRLADAAEACSAS
jgi:D-alanyl-D-alanine carboxypeptidase